MTTLKNFVVAALAFTTVVFAPLSFAEEGAAPASDLVVNEANSLDELLENVRERRVVESRENTARERRFTNEKAEQARLLKQAEDERVREQRRSDRLETQFEENEIRIGDLTEQLDKRLGSLRELFGVLQQVAGDTRGGFEGSIVSSQYANRGDWMGELAKKMGTASQLATIDEMESLWFELQREMTESGKISKYPGTIFKLSGDKVETEIVRVGSFALIGEGQYLQWDADSQSIVELARQPTGRHVSTAEDLQAAAPGEIVEFSVDPTRGSLLALLRYKTRRGASALRSWPRMTPCSSPLSFDHATAAARARSAAAAPRVRLAMRSEIVGSSFSCVAIAKVSRSLSRIGIASAS